jgi:phage head maturation protease
MIREIRDFKEVHDVGPVTFPAYRGTTAMCRSENAEEAQKFFQAEAERRKQILRDLAMKAIS